jgi:hypothetical protein
MRSTVLLRIHNLPSCSIGISIREVSPLIVVIACIVLFESAFNGLKLLSRPGAGWITLGGTGKSKLGEASWIESDKVGQVLLLCPGCRHTPQHVDLPDNKLEDELSELCDCDAIITELLITKIDYLLLNWLLISLDTDETDRINNIAVG